jgi:putative pyruvate formate lyase activating enzyme
MIRLEDAGCSNINLVTPSHFTPEIIDAICLARTKGLMIPIVFNSGGYEKVSTLKVWQTSADIFLMDLKYGDNYAGKRFSRIDDYWDRAREAIAFLLETAGPLVTNDHGRAIKGLIVRHLVLPDMLSNPFAVLEFLAGLSTNIPISIMSQYDPGFYHHDIPGLKRRLKEDEYQVVIKRAMDLGFKTIFTQTMDASKNYSPDFTSSMPFGDTRDMAVL